MSEGKDKRSSHHRMSMAKIEGFKKPFLEEFKKSGFLIQTCKKVGVSKPTVSKWLENDPVFANDYQIACEQITEQCEIAAMIRAVQGWLEPVYQGGKMVGEIRKYSDRLLELLLKARDRKKYGERLEYHVDEDAIAGAIATRFVSIVRRVAPDTCPHCKTRLDLSSKIAEELLALSTRVDEKAAA